MQAHKNVENLCHLLELNTNQICLKLIQKAVEHCGQLMLDSRTTGLNLWTKLHKAFGTFKTLSGTEVAIDPEHLTLDECGGLFKNIAEDYFQNWQHFSNVDSIKIETLFYALLLSFLLIAFMYSLAATNRELNNATCKPTLICEQKIKTTEISKNANESKKQTRIEPTNSKKAKCAKKRTSLKHKKSSITVQVNRADNCSCLLYDATLAGENVTSDQQDEVVAECGVTRLEHILKFIEDYAKEMRVSITINDEKKNRCYKILPFQADCGSGSSLNEDCSPKTQSLS